MSLAHLRELRRGNQRPSAPVSVVIGKAPRWFGEDVGDVVVDRPLTEIDLRPLVGLPIEIFDLQQDAEFTLAVIAELQTLKTTLVGAAGAYGVVGVSPEHERAMKRALEHLCKT